jgi:hypothetical protein
MPDPVVLSFNPTGNSYSKLSNADQFRSFGSGTFYTVLSTYGSQLAADFLLRAQDIEGRTSFEPCNVLVAHRVIAHNDVLASITVTNVHLHL